MRTQCCPASSWFLRSQLSIRSSTWDVLQDLVDPPGPLRDRALFGGFAKLHLPPRVRNVVPPHVVWHRLTRVAAVVDLLEKAQVVGGIAVYDQGRDESARTALGQILAIEHRFPTHEVWRELPRPPIGLKMDEDRNERG